MKLLLDDKQHRGYDLNANEACIFAAILKCTRAGRGWYGNYRELAAAMPFVISHPTVIRAIQKLLTLGLIERREEKLFALVQNEPSLVQNEPSLVQNEPSLVQNVLPPNNPPIINNNMNDKEKEQPRALRTHDGDEQQGADLNFEKFWKDYNVNLAIWPNRKKATRREWNKRSDLAKKALMEAATKNGSDYGTKNPVFFVQDFPEPKPVFLRGDEGGDIVQVRYNGAYKLCTRATMELFGLEWVRDW